MAIPWGTSPTCPKDASYMKLTRSTSRRQPKLNAVRQSKRLVPRVVEADPDVINGVCYPSSDGKPLAETGIHIIAIIQLFGLLRDWFYARRNDVYIAADMFWYWERGNRKARIAPDIMVNFGVTREHERRSFMTWRENGVVPSVTFEMASKGTWRKNLTKSKDIYERRGVNEYFIFDPEFKFLEAPLLGFRLHRRKYFPIAAEPDGSMFSQELGLRLIPRGMHLRIADSETAILVPTAQERAEQEHRVADEQRRRADSLQAEVERLRAELQQRKNGKNGNHSRTS